MNIHILMHESFESPAAIETWANSKNHKISFTKFYLYESLPTEFDFDLLIIMGGPQSPNTTKNECPHFDSESEIKFIKQSIDNNKLVLGICLGAQLIGEALGAKHEHSPNREIGIFDLTLTEDAKLDPIFSTFPNIFPVGHWHGDMPGLTKDSKILAFSQGCPRQIVKYSNRVYGFQCHFEFNLSAIEDMITNSTEELEKYKSLPYIQNIQTLRTNNYDQINEYLFKFLNYFAKIA